MGWHYILQLQCKVRPEFIDFIAKKYLQQYSDSDYSDEDFDFGEAATATRSKRRNSLWEIYEFELPKSYKDLIDIWKPLDINNFHGYELRGDIFECYIEKKVNSHRGLLRNDYETFLKDIIVPITTEIIRCRISSDDVDCFEYDYTDYELRNIPFRLQDKIKSVEHIYSEDKSEIIESRVVYKHSIKNAQVLDLDRAYGIN